MTHIHTHLLVECLDLVLVGLCFVGLVLDVVPTDSRREA